MLRKELPADTEVAEALFHAQVALKTTRGEDVSNMKFGGEVEMVTSVEQLYAATRSPGEFCSNNTCFRYSSDIRRSVLVCICVLS